VHHACLCYSVAALAGLIMSSPLRAEEWHTASAPGASDIIASYKYEDGAALSVICDTDQQHLSIAFVEPQANWLKGQGMNVMTLPDTGQLLSPSYGVIVTPTQVIVKNDATFDLWTMARAKSSFKMSAGDYARVFPTANFRSAVEPVLKACGAHW
jgi:hypothetical protein